MTRVVKVKAVKPPRVAHLAVSESTVRKAAVRLLGQPLVSPEVHYVQRTLGNTATQAQIDDQILTVRKLPWSKIVHPDSL